MRPTIHYTTPPPGAKYIAVITDSPYNAAKVLERMGASEGWLWEKDGQLVVAWVVESKSHDPLLTKGL